MLSKIMIEMYYIKDSNLKTKLSFSWIMLSQEADHALLMIVLKVIHYYTLIWE